MKNLKRLIAKHSPRKTPILFLSQTGNKGKETPGGVSPCIK